MVVEVQVEEEGVVVENTDKLIQHTITWCGPLYSAHCAVMIDRVEDVVARDRPPRVMTRAPGTRRVPGTLLPITYLIWLQLLSI